LAARPLERIFRYNRDDNLATWAVARWLLEQDDLAAASGQAPPKP
jgi:predicted RecB family nuclease